MPRYSAPDWQDQLESDQAVVAVQRAVSDLEQLATDRARFAQFIQGEETIILRDAWIRLGNALSELTKKKLGAA